MDVLNEEGRDRGQNYPCYGAKVAGQNQQTAVYC
jgi:hypothetical protein